MNKIRVAFLEAELGPCASVAVLAQYLYIGETLVLTTYLGDRDDVFNIPYRIYDAVFKSLNPHAGEHAYRNEPQSVGRGLYYKFSPAERYSVEQHGDVFAPARERGLKREVFEEGKGWSAAAEATLRELFDNGPARLIPNPKFKGAWMLPEHLDLV